MTHPLCDPKTFAAIRAGDDLLIGDLDHRGFEPRNGDLGRNGRGALGSTQARM
jgi:hypothetical protein